MVSNGGGGRDREEFSDEGGLRLKEPKTAYLEPCASEQQTAVGPQRYIWRTAQQQRRWQLILGWARRELQEVEVLMLRLRRAMQRQCQACPIRGTVRVSRLTVAG